MPSTCKLHPKFITNADGQQTAVILPIEEYNALLEDLADLAAVAKRSEEPTVSHEQLVKQLKDGPCISD